MGLIGDVCPGNVGVGVGRIYLCVFFYEAVVGGGNAVEWFGSRRRIRKDSTQLCCFLFMCFYELRTA